MSLLGKYFSFMCIFSLADSGYCLGLRENFVVLKVQNTEKSSLKLGIYSPKAWAGPQDSAMVKYEATINDKNTEVSMIRRKYFLAVVFPMAVFFLQSLAATTVSARELTIKDLKGIQKKLKGHEFLTVDFEQDIYNALRSRHRVSGGIAHFRKPQSFRWILIKPKRIEWIYDGKSLINYDPIRKIAKRYGVGNKQGVELRRIVDMVMNLDTLLARYDVLKIEEMEKLVLVRIKPKKSGDITSANLTIDLEKNYISAVKLFFRGKDHTTFSFTNPRPSNLGHGIFKTPKGVQVTDTF